MRLICQLGKSVLHRYLDRIIMQEIKMNSKKEWLLLLLEIQEKPGCLLQVLVKAKSRILIKLTHNYRFRIQLSILNFKIKLPFLLLIMKENSFQDLVKSDSSKKICSKLQIFISNLISMVIFIRIDFILKQASTKLN